MEIGLLYVNKVGGNSVQDIIIMIELYSMINKSTNVT